MENKYIRDKFNGLTEEIYKWDCVSISPFFKEEFRSKTAEKEIADAYLHSAECLYMCFRSENNPDAKIKVFRTNQMCMPFGVRIDIWTHFMRGCIIDYVH